MAVVDEVRTLVGRGRRLLDEHDAAPDPRAAGMALSGALTAFSTARTLLEEAGPGAPAGALAEARFLVGLTLSVRYWRAVEQPEFAGDDGIRAAVLAERDDAAGLLTLTMAAFDQDAPERVEAAFRLGMLLHARYEDGASAGVADPAARADDLDRAIEALRLACPVPVPPGPWHGPAEGTGDTCADDTYDTYDAYDAYDTYDAQDPGALANLGCALADRSERDGAPPERVAADRAAAEAVLEGLLDRLSPVPPHGPDGVPFRPAPDAEPGPAELADPIESAVRECLVRLLLNERDGGPDAERTDRAVAHLEAVAATTAADSPYRLRAGLHLLDLYWARGDGTHIRPDDAAHRFARLCDLRRLIPPGEPFGGTVRWLLGCTLAGRAELHHGGVGAEVHEAVEVLREGLAGMAEDDPVRPPSHAVLGTLVNALHQHDPQTYRTEEAVRHLTLAVDTMQEEDHGVRRGDILRHLADASIAKSQYSADRAELDRVIGLLDDAGARPTGTLWSDEHLHGSLGAAMSKRFALTNAVGDLDAAIRHQRAAFRRAAPDDVNRVVYLENLAVNLYQRFRLAGDHQDLEASRRYTEEVIAYLSHSEHPGVERLLAAHRPILERTRLMLEFQEALAAGDVPRLARTVTALEPLVDAMSEDDPLRQMARGDLGLAMFVHALQSGQAPERAMAGVVLMLDAAERTPPGHLYKNVLTMRVAGVVSLLAMGPPFSESRAEQALKHVDLLIAATDPASMEGSRAHLMRAMLLTARYEHARRPEDIVGALASAEVVRERMRNGTPTQMLAAVNWIIARAHRLRQGPGDRRAGREAGLTTLRQTAAATLLQAAAGPALLVARENAARALTIAGWYLTDRDEAPDDDAPDDEAPDDEAPGHDTPGHDTPENAAPENAAPRDAPGGEREPHLRAVVAALELGRGLVLHASTTTTDVPDLLRSTGHPDLADAWLSSGAAQDGPAPGGRGLDAVLGLPGGLLASLPGGAEIPVPDDLRRRALTALAVSPAGEALMAPSAVAEIADALGAAGADALVYLLPPGAGRSGAAVLVTPGEDGAGDLHLLPLTLVSVDAVRSEDRGPLAAYRRAHLDRQATLEACPPRHPERAAARRRWRATLAELCDWAGTTVLRPLLRHPALRAATRRGPDALPRLVLVPFGELGGVPWHAALLSSGLRDGGRPVRAVERAVISYAASARQFCEVVRRPRLPLGERPVIVGDPTRELMFAEVEAEYLHADHYPHGTLLGYVEDAVGAGTPAEVLAALPAPGRAGASVLHLACHALPSERSPLDAYLGLAPDPRAGDRLGRLPVGDILRQAQGRPPGSPGGLVVLDACVSDHTGGDVDEALTLSSAFLAAGATGVVGSRWEVVDEMVCVLMYVFHGRLAAGDPPVEALRRTQLWALDPDRRLPPGAPPELVSLARRDTGALDVWAAFAYQGN
ncbi:CHAT domain-containing protein [Kitasatospora sp. NPDC058115]|uniref:CHAT domain-containing protein n=1 Tax=Kitasatospora sp. NPDC058115 TaxID=3346347 RepID=UPI0036D84996